VDGGKAFIPDLANAITPRKLKGKQPKVKETQAVPIVPDQDLVAIEAQEDLRVVEIGQDGQIKDVSGENASLLKALQDIVQAVPAESALAVPLYFNLTVLPKWIGSEEDDAEGEAELGINNETGTPAVPQLSNLGKRALGQLRAKGIDVDAEMTEWRREQRRAAKQAAKEKKRKLNTEATSSSAALSEGATREERMNTDAA